MSSCHNNVLICVCINGVCNGKCCVQDDSNIFLFYLRFPISKFHFHLESHRFCRYCHFCRPPPSLFLLSPPWHRNVGKVQTENHGQSPRGVSRFRATRWLVGWGLKLLAIAPMSLPNGKATHILS